MESKGKNPEMIDFLAKDARKLANLRTILVGQISEAETFIRDYCLHYNANQIPQNLLGLLKNDFELGISSRIEDLDQTVRDLLNIVSKTVHPMSKEPVLIRIQEFAWITIHKTRVSTKLGRNVMLLTYVSIFYLPLGFCAVSYRFFFTDIEALCLYALPSILTVR